MQVGQKGKQLAEQKKGTFAINTQNNPKKKTYNLITRKSGVAVEMKVGESVEKEKVVGGKQ